MKVGQRIKKIRLQKNFSLQVLGEKSGIPASTLSDLENNKYSPTLEKADKLAKALGVTVNDLLSDKQEV